MNLEDNSDPANNELILFPLNNHQGSVVTPQSINNYSNPAKDELILFPLDNHQGSVVTPQPTSKKKSNFGLTPRSNSSKKISGVFKPTHSILATGTTNANRPNTQLATAPLIKSKLTTQNIIKYLGLTILFYFSVKYYQDNIANQSSEVAALDTLNQYKVVTRSENLNVRESPTTSSRIILALQKNSTTYGRPLDDDNWLEITNADGSTIGYASSKYLELIDKVSDTTALSVADRLEQEYLKKRDQLSGTNLNNEDSFDLGNLDTVAKFQYKESVIETRDSPIDSKIYDEVDQEPEIIGGIEALHRNLRYPQNARDSGIEGRVFVQFIVDEEGNVIDPVVISGLGGGCDEAALELVREAKFKPGILSGRAVKVNFLLPITFRLNN